MNGFGPIFSVGRLRRAGEETLKLWLPSTLAEAARQEGRDPASRREAPPVRTWHRIPNVASARDDQLPSVATASGGMIEDAEDDGEGRYAGHWGLLFSVHARGRSFEDTAELVGMFCAAIRTSVVQHGDLGGVAESTVFLGEQYDLGDPEATRSLGAGFVSFAVRVPNIVDATAGPDVAPDDPLAVVPPAPAAERFTVIVEPPPID